MYGGRDALTHLPALRDLAGRQAEVVTRAQLLAHGVDHRAVAAQVLAGRWSVLDPVIVVLHRGPLIGVARSWAAVLNAGPGAGLCAWSALGQWGLRGWDRDHVHVVVSRGHTPRPLPFVTLHESRRHSAEDLVVPARRPPSHDVARAAIDAAAWERASRSGCGLLAAVVQQRLTTPSTLFAALDRAGRVRHRRLLAATLLDIEGGADALSEIDLTALCAQHGLPEPRRQAIRTDIQGRRRFRDVEWVLSDGRTVVGEIDGIGHMEIGHWYDDAMRDAELIRGEAGVIRFRLPAAAIRTEPARVVAILRSLLLP